MAQESAPQSWPALLGRAVADAVAHIQAAHPHLRVQPVPADSMITMDYRTDRVRVFFDAAGKVSAVPHTG